MRVTTTYKGWVIEIHSRRHKHFAKGVTFSASAAISKGQALEIDRAALARPFKEVREEQICATSDGEHRTVDLAEADALTRAKAAIDRSESTAIPYRAPSAAEAV